MKLKWLPSLMLVVTTGTAFAGTSTESTVRKLSIEGLRIGAPASELQARIDRLVATSEWKVKYLDTWESRPNAQGLSGAHTLEINHCGPKPDDARIADSRGRMRLVSASRIRCSPPSSSDIHFPSR